MTGEKKRHQVGMKTMEGSRQRKQELVSKLIGREERSLFCASQLSVGDPPYLGNVRPDRGQRAMG